MTFNEAKALVLREGLAGEQAPDEAAFILLHFGDEPSVERMTNLLVAIKTVYDGLKRETVLDRSLAAALWTLGSAANDCLDAHLKHDRKWRDGAEYEVVDLITAVESVFYNVWAVEREV